MSLTGPEELLTSAYTSPVSAHPLLMDVRNESRGETPNDNFPDTGSDSFFRPIRHRCCGWYTMTDENPSEDRIATLEQRLDSFQETISDLRDEVTTLQARIDANRNKLNHLESSPTTNATSSFDQYDAPVVENLSAGHDYTRAEMVAFYRSGGNAVKDEAKIKERISGLVSAGVLEQIEPGRWRCVDGGSDD